MGVGKDPCTFGNVVHAFFFKGGTLDVPEMVSWGQNSFGSQILTIPGVIKIEPCMTYLEVSWRRDMDNGNLIHIAGVDVLAAYFSWTRIRCVDIHSDEQLNHVRREERLPDWMWRIGRS